ncbi:MAG: Fe-S protein assembly co-chaperone HscB [Porticoccaceae bacterium]|nr:Fe-S protein assembly co-chaperone HscB [Porticoccaceae bacterium]
MSTSSQTHFEWFSLPKSFDVDLQKLRSNYLELQKELHPDKVAGKDGVDQNQVVRLNTQLNDAYDKLNDPVKRAIYLLELEGISYDPDRQTQDDPVYLMEQLEIREGLGDLSAEQADLDRELERIRDYSMSQMEKYSAEFQVAHQNTDWSAASVAVGRMMFAGKLARDVNEREEEFLDL